MRMIAFELEPDPSKALREVRIAAAKLVPLTGIKSVSIASIYGEIDDLEKTEITQNTYMEYNERFRFFVLPAVALLLVEVVLLGTRLRKLP